MARNAALLVLLFALAGSAMGFQLGRASLPSLRGSRAAQCPAKSSLRMQARPDGDDTPPSGGALDRRSFGFSSAFALSSLIFTPTAPTWAADNALIPADLPKTYKALYCDRVVSDPDFRKAVQIKEVPMRLPEPDEVIVKVCYAGIILGNEEMRVMGIGKNEDLKNMTEGFRTGSEGLGVIVALGQEAADQGFGIGDNVAWASRNGSFAEYNNVRWGYLQKVAKLQPEALAVRISGAVSYSMLTRRLRADEDMTILITAAAGGFGHMAVQWAKKVCGSRVIAVVGSPEKAKFVKRLGADVVIDSSREKDLSAAIRRAAPKGLDGVIDTVGGEYINAGMANLREGSLEKKTQGGKFVSVGFSSQYPHNPKALREVPTAFNAEELFWAGGSQVNDKFQSIYSSFIPVPLAVAARKEAFELWEEGKVRPVITKTYKGLGSVADAIEDQINRKTMGKVVVEIQGPRGGGLAARAAGSRCMAGSRRLSLVVARSPGAGQALNPLRAAPRAREAPAAARAQRQGGGRAPAAPRPRRLAGGTGGEASGFGIRGSGVPTVGLHQAVVRLIVTKGCRLLACTKRSAGGIRGGVARDQRRLERDAG
eukprot:CAMPEP_0174928346 /NCGR_PEP_ID=MMETSP1355-20121228/22865_1 /TAXON_ID=464990 /ORGANISM="Hemiselmis tepida, Strain CCMP443" /LENGTH=595 /DNA_ID=CAMNT_0016174503 /DNA_START=63 /DNA_END=1848 /DNA_ORIENTATION=+